MDPRSISSSAVALAGLVYSVIKTIRNAIESMKKRREALIALLARTERMRLLLEQIGVLTRLMRSPQEVQLKLTFDEQPCKDLVKKIEAIVVKVSASSALGSLGKNAEWLLHQDEVEKLVSELQGREVEFQTLLLLICSLSGLKTRNQMEDIIAKTDAQSKVHPVFSESQSSDANSQKYMQMWLGNTLTDSLDSSYVFERQNLANATYTADWDSAFKVIERARAKFDESWVNATRLKPRKMAHEISHWTPLHQAAYLDSSPERIQELLNVGASRTIRCQWTPFDDKDMTPCELAQLMGFEHLVSILSPVIRHNVPYNVIQKLETEFHRLVEKQIGHKKLAEAHIRMPQLATLTELAIPQMMFLIRLGPKTAELKTWKLRLDRRELIVEYSPFPQSTEISYHRISTTGISEVDCPVITGVVA